MQVPTTSIRGSKKIINITIDCVNDNNYRLGSIFYLNSLYCKIQSLAILYIAVKDETVTLAMAPPG